MKLVNLFKNIIVLMMVVSLMGTINVFGDDPNTYALTSFNFTTKVLMNKAFNPSIKEYTMIIPDTLNKLEYTWSGTCSDPSVEPELYVKGDQTSDLSYNMMSVRVSGPNKDAYSDEYVFRYTRTNNFENLLYKSENEFVSTYSQMTLPIKEDVSKVTSITRNDNVLEIKGILKDKENYASINKQLYLINTSFKNREDYTYSFNVETINNQSGEYKVIINTDNARALNKNVYEEMRYGTYLFFMYAYVDGKDVLYPLTDNGLINNPVGFSVNYETGKNVLTYTTKYNEESVPNENATYVNYNKWLLKYANMNLVVDKNSYLKSVEVATNVDVANPEVAYYVLKGKLSEKNNNITQATASLYERGLLFVNVDDVSNVNKAYYLEMEDFTSSSSTNEFSAVWAKDNGYAMFHPLRSNGLVNTYVSEELPHGTYLVFARLKALQSNYPQDVSLYPLNDVSILKELPEGFAMDNNAHTSKMNTLKFTKGSASQSGGETNNEDALLKAYPFLSIVADNDMEVASDSLVSSISASEDSFIMQGKILAANDYVGSAVHYNRELVLLNLEAFEAAKAKNLTLKSAKSDLRAAMQEVKALSYHLTINSLISNNTYANYKVEVDLRNIPTYIGNSKEEIANGTYLLFMRIDDGKTSYLYPMIAKSNAIYSGTTGDENFGSYVLSGTSQNVLTYKVDNTKMPIIEAFIGDISNNIKTSSEKKWIYDKVELRSNVACKWYSGNKLLSEYSSRRYTLEKGYGTFTVYCVGQNASGSDVNKSNQITFMMDVGDIPTINVDNPKNNDTAIYLKANKVNVIWHVLRKSNDTYVEVASYSDVDKILVKEGNGAYEVYATSKDKDKTASNKLHFNVPYDSATLEVVGREQGSSSNDKASASKGTLSAKVLQLVDGGIYDGIPVVAIRNAVKDANAKSINVNLEKPTTIPSEVFATLRGKDIEMNISVMKANKDVAYGYTFNGKDLQIAKNMELEISNTSSKAERIYSGVNSTKEKVKILDFTHSGTLPGKAEVIYNVSDQFADNSVLELVYFNDSTMSVTSIQNNLLVEDGYVRFSIDHCSTYALVLKTGNTISSSSEARLGAYSKMNMNVYANSRVTSIKQTSNGFLVQGYMFEVDTNYLDPKKCTLREIVFVNTNNASTAYAYRKKVSPVYNTFLNTNTWASNRGQYRLDYACYEVEVNPKQMYLYSDGENKNVMGMRSGTYEVYMRISNGKTSYLFPLVDRVLSDGSSMQSSGNLPKGFTLKDQTTRQLIYKVS